MELLLAHPVQSVLERRSGLFPLGFVFGGQMVAAVVVVAGSEGHCSQKQELGLGR